MSQKLKDLLTRVARTWAQTALAMFAVTAFGPLQRVWADVLNWASGTGNIDTANVNALRAAAVSAIGAGLVACFSLVHNLINDYLKSGNNLPLVGKPEDTKIGDKILSPTDPAYMVEPGKP